MFFDLDKIINFESKWPRMLPSSSYFAKIMQEQFGITNEDHIIIYEDKISYRFE